MGLGSAFTILAVLEATDKMSSVLDRVDGALDAFSDTAKSAADAATAAGTKIDESLLQTASGADALDLATTRAAAAQEKMAAATAAQAEAETALLEASAAIASEEELAVAAEAVAKAQAEATTTAGSLAEAQSMLSVAKEASVSEADLAAASDLVALAQQRATAAATELTAAQARQEALVTSDDVAAAATALTAAEKSAAKATTEASAAQERQEGVARAQAAANAEAADETDAVAAAQARMDAANDASSESSGLASKAFGITGLAIAAIGYESIKAAGNFQSLTEHLVTDAGESQSNLKMVQQQILGIASATGTSTTTLANAAYVIESAGIHGKKAMDDLSVAAQGAKVGGAEVSTVAYAMATSMNAYGSKAGTATQITNEMISTVAAGDMKMQDLATALSAVTPVAAAAGISFSQVGAAIATMTSQGMSAQQAAQDLGHSIKSLQNPNATQIQEMQQLGINVTDLSTKMGSRGLTGTYQVLIQAITSHMGAAGTVMMNAFNQSSSAAADANTIFSKLGPAAQKLAKEFEDGSIGVSAYRTAAQGLGGEQGVLAAQFETTYSRAKGFNSLLTSGSPAAQTFTAALSKVTGGSTGLNTALMLTGQHSATFEKNAAAIGVAGKSTSKSVQNWSTIQGTFNQKMDRLKSSVEAAGVMIGMKLLPVVSKVAGAFANIVTPILSWINHNQKLVGMIGAVAIGMAAAAVSMKLVEIQGAILEGVIAILNGELDADPIMLVVLAIGALVAGLIYAYTHFKTFRDIVNDVFGFFKTIVMAVVDAVVAAWHGLVAAAEWLWHALGSVWSAVSGAVTTVWHVIEDAWNAVASVTSTVWNAISGFFSKWWPLLLVIFELPIALLIAAWNHFGGDIMSAAQDTWNAISGFFVGIWHDITSAADAAWNLFKRYVITPIQQVWAELQPIIHDVESFLASVWHDIESVASSVWNAIKLAIIDPITEIWQTIVRIGGDIVSAISGALHKAWDAVSSVGSWFLQIGSDIVNGIISGVENAGGALFSSLENLAGGALKAAKSFLGINSPSKLFADEVGLSIPEGIAKGINDNASIAHKAVAALSSGLTATAHTAVTGSMSIAGSGLTALGQGGGGGATIEIHNHFEGANVMSDADMTQLAAKVGKAVTKSLAPGGLHLRIT
jgi:phage-related protein/chemotaxis protein histidine kinase CheA